MEDFDPRRRLGAERRAAAPARPPAAAEPPLLALQQTAGNAATARLARVLYKDDKARREGGAYKNIEKVPWYTSLKNPRAKEIALALHKRTDAHLTIAEATQKIEAILAGRETLAEEDDGYDSGAEHEEVEAGDRILTVTEFNRLGPKGTINPFRLRTAQPGIEKSFADKSKGTVESLAQRLALNPDLARQLPPVKIGVYKNRVYSFDTRRVVACQMARARNAAVVINYEKIDDKDKANRVSSVYGARPWMGIVTAVREQGLKSGSMPHVNPAYASQLDDVVQQTWQWRSPLGFPDQQPPREQEEDDAADAELQVALAQTIAEAKHDDAPIASGDEESLGGVEQVIVADKTEVRGEFEQAQTNFQLWAKQYVDTPPSPAQVEHAATVMTYIEGARGNRLNLYALNGWLLDDVYETALSLSPHLRIYYLWEWRVPPQPDSSRTPLLRWLHGG